jgi:predicted DNA-binding transcriptional regulator AlpA
MSIVTKNEQSADIAEKGPAHERKQGSRARSIETTRRVASPNAAELLGISESTLRKWRMSGIGPRFIKVGSRVVYDTGELEDWLERRSRTQTTSYLAPKRGEKDKGSITSSRPVVTALGEVSNG